MFFIIGSGIIVLVLLILRVMPFSPILSIPLSLIAAMIFGCGTFVATEGAHFLKRFLMTIHIAVCTGFIFAFIWNKKASVSVSQSTQDTTRSIQSTQSTCQFSYCVSPGTRVDLDTSNCTTHTENLAESLRKKSTGTDSALDRMCIGFTNYSCITCNGACVDTSVSTCSTSQSQLDERDRRLKPSDEIWQLSNSELLQSWQMHS